jgi:hypothetical protein
MRSADRPNGNGLPAQQNPLYHVLRENASLYLS